MFKTTVGAALNISYALIFAAILGFSASNASAQGSAPQPAPTTQGTGTILNTPENQPKANAQTSEFDGTWTMTSGNVSVTGGCKWKMHTSSDLVIANSCRTAIISGLITNISCDTANKSILLGGQAGKTTFHVRAQAQSANLMAGKGFSQITPTCSADYDVTLQRLAR